jgi:cysteine desulfurase
MVYLDYAASAPARPRALRAWMDAPVEANPSSPHGPGRAARALLDQAREEIALALGAQAAEVILTASGTEADALAVRGLFAARNADGTRPYLLIGATEHHAVSDNAQMAPGARVVTIPVDGDGRIDMDWVADHLRDHGDQTALISVMRANNETGTVQDIDTLVALSEACGVSVHTDAVQAAGRLAFEFDVAHLAAASFSGHKVGGPVGTGILLAARREQLKPVIGGGGQERGVRSGTVDVRGARALAAALTEAVAEQRAGAPAHLEQLLAPLDALVASHELTTSRTPAAPAAHLPGLRCFTARGCPSEVLLYLLDQHGIAVSAGAACNAGVARPSEVLMAMGLPADDAATMLRVSVGHASTAQDVAALVAALPEVLDRAHQVGQRSRPAAEVSDE